MMQEQQNIIDGLREHLDQLKCSARSKNLTAGPAAVVPLESLAHGSAHSRKRESTVMRMEQIDQLSAKDLFGDGTRNLKKKKKATKRSVMEEEEKEESGPPPPPPEHEEDDDAEFDAWGEEASDFNAWGKETIDEEGGDDSFSI